MAGGGVIRHGKRGRSGRRRERKREETEGEGSRDDISRAF